MKKKVLILFVISLFLFTITACNSKKKEANYGKEFKEDYEEINGQENKNGNVHRTITLSEYNKFIETTPEEIVKKIESGDSFYVYFGSRLCPWCRSVIEKADEVSRLNDIEKIYYIDIWDDEGNEIFRNKYELDENNNPIKTFEGTKEYYTLLDVFKDYLRDYTLTDADKNTINVGEKRIYAPNFVYISKGKAKRLVSGKSELQNNSREDLTEEMLNDEEKVFNEFFVNACDESC